MFNVGDTVSYGAQGVCKIEAIEEKKIGRLSKEYYVLKMVYETNNTIYVPTDNELLVSKMRSVISEGEIAELIASMPQDTVCFDTDDINRRRAQKEILSSGDRRAIASVIKALYLEQCRRKEAGKKLPLADEQILNHAEKLLYNELALVLNIKPDEVIPFIAGQIEPDALKK